MPFCRRLALLRIAENGLILSWRDQMRLRSTGRKSDESRSHSCRTRQRRARLRRDHRIFRDRRSFTYEHARLRQLKVARKRALQSRACGSEALEGHRRRRSASHRITPRRNKNDAGRHKTEGTKRWTRNLRLRQKSIFSPSPARFFCEASAAPY